MSCPVIRRSPSMAYRRITLSSLLRSLTRYGIICRSFAATPALMAGFRHSASLLVIDGGPRPMQGTQIPHRITPPTRLTMFRKLIDPHDLLTLACPSGNGAHFHLAKKTTGHG